MSTVYNYLRDGGMILKIKPTITNCNTLKVFPTFDVGLKHLLTVANGTGTGSYTGNELIQIIANSVQDYYFDHWTDPQSVVTDVNSGTTTVTMPFLDCTVTAVILPYRTLTVNNGSGSSNILKPGDVRQIVANAPAQNYVFDNWSGDTAYLSTNTETANVTMPDANVILTANYKINYTIIEYGLLYNWFVASDVRKFVNGWHVPTMTEFQILSDYLGGNAVSGGKMKTAGFVDWDTPNTGGTNESGFNLKGHGGRSQSGGFLADRQNAWIWTSSDRASPLESDAAFNHTSSICSVGIGQYNHRTTGEAIRLLCDSSTDPGYVIIDGDVYSTIKIGNQVWLASNLKATHFSDGSVIPEVTNGTSWTALTTGALCAYENDWNNV